MEENEMTRLFARTGQGQQPAWELLGLNSAEAGRAGPMRAGACQRKKCPNLSRIFVRVYLSQNDNDCQEARSQVRQRMTCLQILLCNWNSGGT